MPLSVSIPNLNFQPTKNRFSKRLCPLSANTSVNCSTTAKIPPNLTMDKQERTIWLELKPEPKSKLKADLEPRIVFTTLTELKELSNFADAIQVRLNAAK
ncbi:hypothetical protein IMSHALPRED_000148 [Imshaugia aleurites]|uniref:Uncharacterized protein n=1 Tax=Imshaugia aleurites TaxID=172621 RepID=A0A8H3EFL2_9LECA|nr:hypothetical protein IMSHALPRED_000148 [Imshaugia aleurites]